jgi:hypothetical protein
MLSAETRVVEGSAVTKEEILALGPGEELNVLVAEQVMGNAVVKDATFGRMERVTADGGSIWCPLEPYSEEMAAAETVVNVMIGRGCEDAIYWADFGNGRFTEPEAICKAALLALLETAERLESAVRSIFDEQNEPRSTPKTGE